MGTLLTVLSACGGGAGGSVTRGSSTTSQGVVQKGPFEISTVVVITQLDSSGLETSNKIQTKVHDNKGSFTFDIPSDWDFIEGRSFLHITAEGFYFDEFSGSKSDKKIILTSITSSAQLNSVNLLSHWVAKRTQILLQGGESLQSAIQQSENELSSIFGINHGQELDISQSEKLPADNALLLLLSGALMDVAQQNGVDPQQIIDEISKDFSDDGVLTELGDDWFIRMQTKIRDNPQTHINLYAKALKSELELDAPTGKELPEVIPLASRPLAVLPRELTVKPGETVRLDGSESHDNPVENEGLLINHTWFRVDQQAFKVPLSDRFSQTPSITVPNQEVDLLFALVVTDEQKLTDTAVMKVIVRNPISTNTPPIAVDDTKNTNEDTPLTLGLADIVTSNDTDADGDTLSINMVSAAVNGSVVLFTDGSITFTPELNFVGSGSFQYTISDGNGGIDTATVTINISAVNDVPVGVADSANTNEDTAVNIAVVGNDTDVEGDTLTPTNISTPSNGTATLSVDGVTIDYIPNTSFNGTDTFTYTPNDGTVDGVAVTVTVTVVAQNDAPVGVTDSANTNEDTAVNISVVGNDTDAEGDTLTPTNISTPSNGTATLNADGVTIDYTPNANFNGTDTFTYTPSDGTTDGLAVTVIVTVVAVNDAPVGIADSANTNEDTAVNIAVIGNDTDAEGDTLTPTNISTPSNGTATLNADGVTIDYTPNTNFNGTDTFTYVPNDGTTSGSAVTVTITVATQNDAPVGVADSANTNEDAVVNIAVVTNDTDAEGDTLTPTNISTPSNGTAALNADGVTIDYTPNTNFNGTDTFTYTPNDGTSNGAAVTVTVTVVAQNDAPVGVADSANTNEDTAVNIAVVANDTDTEGDTLAPINISTPSNGVATLNADGVTVDYTPNANFNGTDTFTYTPSDGTTDGVAVTVTVTVVAVNDAPVGVADSANTNEDTSVNIAVVDNDTDAEGDTLAPTNISTPSNGTATLNADGVTIDYTPSTNFNGTDTFTYIPNDGTTDGVAVTVTVTVAAVNDAPTARSFTLEVNQDSSVNFVEGSGATQLGGTDPEGDSLKVVDRSGPLNNPSTGSVVVTNLSAGNIYTYVPNKSFCGTDSIQYKVQEISSGLLKSAFATVTFNVNCRPVAGPVLDIAMSDTDTTAGITLTGSDSDGSIASYKVITPPSFGMLTGVTVDSPFVPQSVPQQLTYTPLSIPISDSFTFTVIDDQGLESSPTTVNIVVTSTGPVFSYIKASDPTAGFEGDGIIGDLFGYKVSLDANGTTLAVGAEEKNAVYVFSFTGSGWVQQQKIQSVNNEMGDFFGSDVALSDDGNTLIIGASGEDSSAIGVGGDQTNNDIADSGAVYVFKRSSSTWSQQAYIKASNTGMFDKFGSAVTISGDGKTMAVGTSGEDSIATGIDSDQIDDSANSAGAVYIFKDNGSNWSQEAYVKASNTERSDQFGGAVSLNKSGDALIVGAVGEDAVDAATGVNISSSGAVYSFIKLGVNWLQQGTPIRVTTPVRFDRFGTSLSLSGDGNTFASSAIGHDQDSGATYIFTKVVGATWTEQALLKASNKEDFDHFGNSVSLSESGDKLLIGAPLEDSSSTGVTGADPLLNDANGAGAVYLFDRVGSNWFETLYVKASNTNGGFDASNPSGQKASLGDQFGTSVAISGDGNSTAVGAPYEESSSPGVNGDQSINDFIGAGAVYVNPHLQ